MRDKCEILRPRQGDQRPQPAILNSHRLQWVSSINLANHYTGYGGNLIFPRFAAWCMTLITHRKKEGSKELLFVGAINGKWCRADSYAWYAYRVRGLGVINAM